MTNMDLFRNSRLKFLSKNNFKNYLLFAIGEIILIVVGILVALYINNLNEERKLKNELKKYKVSLLSDLNKDILTVTNEIDSLVSDTSNISDFFRRMSHPATTVDTLIKIYRYEFNPYIWGSMSFNNNTLNSLKSTGNLSNLEDWLQNELIDIIELKENYISIRNDIKTYVDLLLLEHNHYPVNEPGKWMKLEYKDSDLCNKIWEQAKLEELGSYMFHLFSVKYTIEAAAIKHLQQIELKTISLLERLNAGSD
jgi:hypothetical protein